MLDALAAFGAPEDLKAQVADQVTSGDYEILPENVQSLNVFLSLATCWDWLAPAWGKPVRVGIRATEIESTLRLMCIKGKRRMQAFADIRAMETAVLEVFHK